MVARTLPQHPWPCTWLPHISSTRTHLWCWQSPCFWAGCGFSPCSMKWFPKTGVVFPKTDAAGDTVMSSPWWPGTPLHLRPCVLRVRIYREASLRRGACALVQGPTAPWGWLVAQATQQLLSSGPRGAQAVVGHGGSLWQRAVHSQPLRSRRDLCGAEHGHAMHGDVLADKQRCAHRDTGTRAVLPWDVHTGTGGCASQAHASKWRGAHRDQRGAVLGVGGRARRYRGTRTPGAAAGLAAPHSAGAGATGRGGARHPAGASHWLTGLSAGRSDSPGPGLARWGAAGWGQWHRTEPLRAAPRRAAPDGADPAVPCRP